MTRQKTEGTPVSHRHKPGHRGHLQKLLTAALLSTFLALPALAMILTVIDIKRDGPGALDLLGGARSVAVTGDGQNVYVVAQNDHGLTAFARNPPAGSLSFLEDHENEEGGVFGLRGASGVVTSPDGRHVYATARLDDTLVVFARDATADELTFVAAQAQENNVGGVIGLDGASAVAVSSDNTQVFAAAAVDDALAVFSRDASTDELTFVEAELNGSAGVAGLDGANAVAVSPDNRHVYVTGGIDDSVAVFRRQSGGRVAFVARYKNGVGGVRGLDGASGVAVSPDGRHVYVTGRLDRAVATFRRNPLSGRLTFLEVDRDGFRGVDGLAGAVGVAVSPDGRRVFVAGRADNAVAVFRRNPLTGALVFLEAVIDGVGGADGLGGAFGLTVSADGRHVYVASLVENAVVGLRVRACLGNESSGDTDADAVCDDLDLCLGDDFAGDHDGDLVCDDLDACPEGTVSDDPSMDGEDQLGCQPVRR